MWKPAKVVPEHKRRATAIWCTLVVAFLGYTAWQIYGLRDEFDNPSTAFEISDELYAFPPLEVCFFEGYGCDTRLETTTCIDSATTRVRDSCNNEDEDAEIPSQWTNCLSFDLPSLDLTGYESGCTSGYNPSAFVTVEWYESFDPFDEDNYTAAVALYLGDETEPEFTLVPYSRLIESSDGSSSLESHYMVTTVTFGKTTRYPISGDSTTSYPILTIATSDYVDFSRSDYSSDTDDGHNDSYAQADDSYARGYLHLTLTQGTYSVTDIRDIDPDIGNLLGNIGGFWELVLVAWGVCFIATRVDIPTHRGRNFTKVIRRAKDIAGKRKRRRSSTGTEASDAEEYVNGPAEWSAEEKACQDVSRGDDIIVVPPVRAPAATIVLPSFRRTPIPRVQPMRSPSLSHQPV